MSFFVFLKNGTALLKGLFRRPFRNFLTELRKYMSIYITAHLILPRRILLYGIFLKLMLNWKPQENPAFVMSWRKPQYEISRLRVIRRMHLSSLIQTLRILPFVMLRKRSNRIFYIPISTEKLWFPLPQRKTLTIRHTAIIAYIFNKKRLRTPYKRGCGIFFLCQKTDVKYCCVGGNEDISGCKVAEIIYCHFLGRNYGVFSLIGIGKVLGIYH